jgi:hypothetical protein
MVYGRLSAYPKYKMGCSQVGVPWGGMNVGGVRYRMYKMGGVAAGWMVHDTNASSHSVAVLIKLVGGQPLAYSFVSNLRHAMAERLMSCYRTLLYTHRIRISEKGRRHFC